MGGEGLSLLHFRGPRAYRESHSSTASDLKTKAKSSVRPRTRRQISEQTNLGAGWLAGKQGLPDTKSGSLSWSSRFTKGFVFKIQELKFFAAETDSHFKVSQRPAPSLEEASMSWENVGPVEGSQQSKFLGRMTETEKAEGLHMFSELPSVLFHGSQDFQKQNKTTHTHPHPPPNPPIPPPPRKNVSRKG